MMSPASSSGSPPAAASNSTGSCLVVAWDLDTTGRRLIDEICQIGAYAVIPPPHGSPAQATEPEEGADDTQTSAIASSESLTFSQYVMPYRNPNPGARRSFGIKVCQNFQDCCDFTTFFFEIICCNDFALR